jgi:hypothetical protein
MKAVNCQAYRKILKWQFVVIDPRARSLEHGHRHWIWARSGHHPASPAVKVPVCRRRATRPPRLTCRGSRGLAAVGAWDEMKGSVRSPGRGGLPQGRRPCRPCRPPPSSSTAPDSLGPCFYTLAAGDGSRGPQRHQRCASRRMVSCSGSPRGASPRWLELRRSLRIELVAT